MRFLCRCKIRSGIFLPVILSNTEDFFASVLGEDTLLDAVLSVTVVLGIVFSAVCFTSAFLTVVLLAAVFLGLACTGSCIVAF